MDQNDTLIWDLIELIVFIDRNLDPIGYDEIQPETGLSQRQMDQDIEAALDTLDD